ncbi:hypothetical protein MHW47_05280 [Streptomyces sp. OfavH-34-F]|uniref:hypothetical protein n=1 Tax=Streptomyces sp. OfavH-34-F TaxID=2917760 RepID=UPI001EF34DE5|nr:hypothetical protein [Streptomyces sp. OfavH-34-F]MCG7523860.1 hypothetical protein [Streptomyces sp. OfavH-34-F]
MALLDRRDDPPPGGCARQDAAPSDVPAAALPMPTPKPTSSPPAPARGERRPARSRVRHGQPSCADYGCTRPACLVAARKARRERDRERAAGRRGRVDSEAAAQHALALRDFGMSAQDIADDSGVAVTLIRRLLRPAARRPVQVSRVTADAVLGIPLPPEQPATPRAGRGQVDADPAAALLTELAERGWPAACLAARLCINARTVAAIRDGRHARISIAVDQRIRTQHAQLLALDPIEAGVRPGDAARVRTWAARRAETSRQRGPGRSRPGCERPGNVTGTPSPASAGQAHAGPSPSTVPNAESAAGRSRPMPCGG